MLTEPYTAYRNTLQKSVLMMYTELYQMRTAMHRSYSTMYRRLATAHNICTHRLCIIYNLCIVGLHLYTNILTVLCLVQRICIATEPRPSSVRVWYWDYIYKVWPSVRVWYTEKHGPHLWGSGTETVRMKYGPRLWGSDTETIRTKYGPHLWGSDTETTHS